MFDKELYEDSADLYTNEADQPSKEDHYWEEDEDLVEEKATALLIGSYAHVVR